MRLACPFSFSAGHVAHLARVQHLRRRLTLARHRGHSSAEALHVGAEVGQGGHRAKFIEHRHRLIGRHLVARQVVEDARLRTVCRAGAGVLDALAHAL